MRRAVLWLAYRTCHWCSRETVWTTHGGAQPDDAATVDHLFPRGDPRRGSPSSTVLSCYACNHDRGREWSAALVAAREAEAGDANGEVVRLSPREIHVEETAMWQTNVQRIWSWIGDWLCRVGLHWPREWEPAYEGGDELLCQRDDCRQVICRRVPPPVVHVVPMRSVNELASREPEPEPV